jgi:hypothetical protein
VETEGSLSYSQQPTTEPHLDQQESSANYQSLSLWDLLNITSSSVFRSTCHNPAMNTVLSFIQVSRPELRMHGATIVWGPTCPVPPRPWLDNPNTEWSVLYTRHDFIGGWKRWEVSYWSYTTSFWDTGTLKQITLITEGDIFRLTDLCIF